MKNQKTEKTILRISFFSGLIFAIVEFFFSIYSHSQSVLMDAVYDASELVFIALILFLTPLFYRPISEKHPYGFFQIESIFVIIKGFMLLSVSLSVSMEILDSALTGGNPVDEMLISGFQLVLGLISVVIFLVMRKLNEPLASPTVDAEILGWKIDIAYSLGMSFAFFAGTFLDRTPLAFIAPYFDQILAILIMVCMLPESIKMLWRAIKDVFLFSPGKETVDRVKAICTHTMEQNHFEPVFFDITRTGRRLWVAVYFKISGQALPVEDLRRATDQINGDMQQEFDNCTCELILLP